MEKMTSFCRRLVAFSILLVVAISSASGRFVVEKSSVKVLSPEHLVGRHDAAIANFGLPDYGGALTGVVMYPGRRSTGCGAFGATLKSKTNRPAVLLLDRGDCYFALKAWNGQQAGAAAVLIADTYDEPLLAMNSSEEGQSTDYVEKISIPSALIGRGFGEALKNALANDTGEEVIVKLDWRESMPRPDDRVEYEFWTSSNDECGARCDDQVNFVKNFKGHAQLLEQGGFTKFTPHYITLFCPEAFTGSKQCRLQCINNGRYCSPDPELVLGQGYDGREIVMENLRQLCVHRVANGTGRPWVWWNFVTDYHIRCSMKEKHYSNQCAEDVVRLLSLPLDEVSKCMGDPEADVENEVLKREQELQFGRGTQGDVTILPTLVINKVQYRGKLESSAVLKAICAGFKETAEPAVCLNKDIETNQCADSNGGCWQDTRLNVTACKDTFRGRVCECPVVNNVRYQGDGYTTCTAVGPGRCAMDNGGCWSETIDGHTFSACSDSELSGCHCPYGFYGDGYTCEDLDECKEKLACNCPECSCKNTWGGYDCKCKGNLVYMKGEDTCIAKTASSFGWVMAFLVLLCVTSAGISGYIFYNYRLRSYMDSEIVAIMSHYMPIESRHKESQPLRQCTTA